jgi:hypothetical protein
MMGMVCLFGVRVRSKNHNEKLTSRVVRVFIRIPRVLSKGDFGLMVNCANGLTMIHHHRRRIDGLYQIFVLFAELVISNNI